MKPVKVSQLNNYINRILSSDPILSKVSVKGEISNLKHHSSGHVYFTLKDESSRLNCFLSADALKRVRYELDDGIEIIADGYISVYERGGYYSLNVLNIEIEGIGDLAAAFQLLKDKLQAEGLFDVNHKKPIPFFSQKIAVVTSDTGAALKDILRIIKNRNNYTDILIYPVLVQGVGAAGDISSAIQNINETFPEIDVIIVGRGGGSTEDLWAFNEEVVARAIYKSKIPIISAVGHEIDFTISDFVADVRAETPTAAAVLAVPDIEELKIRVKSIKEIMLYYIKRNLDKKETALENLTPQNVLKILNSNLDLMRIKVDSCYKQLSALSPLNIMERGYGAVAFPDGSPVISSKQLNEGDGFIVTFKDGAVSAMVTKGDK
ncbi:MAG: exodeoxyribonuclease VII large subunit [Eubacteriales bacterium]|nr:exodeoxyribonuclease VII large subunit [Eubacteriales bacterium]MDD4389453.1 exodeoxyribonuclease VII large subunit [Eubacteriales bacterium]